MLQAMKEEPPLNAKCKDKFLIQTMLIPSEKAALPLHDLVRPLLRKLIYYLTRILMSQWNTPEGEEQGKVHSQKVKVNYLPPEGHPLEEEDELPHRSSMMSGIAPDDAVSIYTLHYRVYVSTSPSTCSALSGSREEDRVHMAPPETKFLSCKNLPAMPSLNAPPHRSSILGRKTMNPHVRSQLVAWV